MEQYKTRAELKSDTKELFRGRWKDAILLNLIPTLITFIAFLVIVVVSFSIANQTNSSIENWTNDSYVSEDIGESSNSGNGTSNVTSGILSTLFTVGISFTFLDWFRDPDKKIHPIKNSLQVFSRKYFLRAFLIYILTSIFTTLWSLLFIIPGIIKHYAYSQAYLIYKDQTNLSPNEKISSLNCITESKNLMRGHKWRFFLLEMSFIGWGILAVLSLGIGFLWLFPYENATRVAFYEDLTKGKYLNEQDY